ncbi:MAG: hypothetical protein PVG32_14395 [Anaerolineales bacterium]|jgi:TolB protein
MLQEIRRTLFKAFGIVFLFGILSAGLMLIFIHYFGPERMLFTSLRDGNYELFAMNLDGSAFCPLTAHVDDDYNASWSPDGLQIAFTSHRDGDYEIYRMNSDGTGLVRLTTTPGIDDNPDWSPNGHQIAFTSNRDGNAEVYIMEADGSNQTRLTDSPAYDLRPAWSPDGKLIAFESTRIETEPWRSGDFIFKIYIMNSDGSNQSLWSIQDDRFPAWSPNQREIAFVSFRNGSGEIFIMKVDRSQETQITNYLEDPAVDGQLTWSPDGKQLAFGSDNDGNGQVYLLDRDSSDLVQLTYGSTDNGGPDWIRYTSIPGLFSWWRLKDRCIRPGLSPTPIRTPAYP